MKTNLFETHDPMTWHLQRWPEFVEAEDKDNTTVILPISGFTDWGLGFGMDAEEIVLSSILKETLSKTNSSHQNLVLPPLRFVFAPYAYSFFGMDQDTVHESLEDLLKSIKASGFKKILFLNSSPWNEGLVDAAGRDLRIKLGLPVFIINLSGIDLDFLPGRSTSRPKLQQLLTFLTKKEGKLPSKQVPLIESSFSPVHFKEMPTEATCPTLEDANSMGPEVLKEASNHLESLLQEVSTRPALKNNGVIPTKSKT